MKVGWSMELPVFKLPCILTATDQNHQCDILQIVWPICTVCSSRGHTLSLAADREVHVNCPARTSILWLCRNRRHARTSAKKITKRFSALTPFHPEIFQVKSSGVFQDLYFSFLGEILAFLLLVLESQNFWISSIISLSIKADKSSSQEKGHHGKGRALSVQTTFLYSLMGPFDVLKVRILT